MRGIFLVEWAEPIQRDDWGIENSQKLKCFYDRLACIREQLAGMESATDPINVFRDPARNECLSFDLSAFPVGTSYIPGSACGPYGPQDSPIQAEVDELYMRAAKANEVRARQSAF
jgi:hypothetical protein